MDEVKINTTKTVSIDLGNDPDDDAVFVTVHHEFGDTITGPAQASRSASGVYNFLIGEDGGGEPLLNSAGKYRVDFAYEVGGEPYSRSQYINVYTPYANASQFFAIYPELQATNAANFDLFERRARNIINTYCGQSFDPYINKKLTVNGTNNNVLHLPLPIARLGRVVVNEGEVDEATFFDPALGIRSIEKIRQPFNFESTFYIRFKKGLSGITERILEAGKFRDTASYSVTGDWGWPYVPTNVSQASSLIIADLMNDDSEYRRHGIVSMDMDNIRFAMKPSFYESTGNIEADVLLTDYTLFVMDYII